MVRTAGIASADIGSNPIADQMAPSNNGLVRQTFNLQMPVRFRSGLLMAKFRTLEYGVDSKPTFREFDSLLSYNNWPYGGMVYTQD